MEHNLAPELNLVGSFLAAQKIDNLLTCERVDCVVLCASSVLVQAEWLFQALLARPDLTKTLVLVGGIGHSTQLIYDAVARHPVYRSLTEQVTGLPEARVLQCILQNHFDHSKVQCRVLVEDQSTNCGSNAIETRKVLEEAGVPTPRTCAIVQDPTMSLRTIASFVQAYKSVAKPPLFLGCPMLVPRMRQVGSTIEYDVPGLSPSDLWPKSRFYELIVGEIPRLKDDESGYGPNGKGFIPHVDVPQDVEAAASKIREALRVDR